MFCLLTLGNAPYERQVPWDVCHTSKHNVALEPKSYCGIPSSLSPYMNTFITSACAYVLLLFCLQHVVNYCITHVYRLMFPVIYKYVDKLN